ncbi:MAG: hypothetical protein F4227_03835 [Gammaproteobacteria bacterium]|nr:hypothetical protein [Gammaproteobacteria bacterium]MYF02113.1 hypothetical protein [Gammaproteobacteria bacterium]
MLRLINALMSLAVSTSNREDSAADCSNIACSCWSASVAGDFLILNLSSLTLQIFSDHSRCAGGWSSYEILRGSILEFDITP